MSCVAGDKGVGSITDLVGMGYETWEMLEMRGRGRVTLIGASLTSTRHERVKRPVDSPSALECGHLEASRMSIGCCSSALAGERGG